MISHSIGLTRGLDARGLQNVTGAIVGPSWVLYRATQGFQDSCPELSDPAETYGEELISKESIRIKSRSFRV
jgi:hypothetical protein